MYSSWVDRYIPACTRVPTPPTRIPVAPVTTKNKQKLKFESVQKHSYVILENVYNAESKYIGVI